MNQTDVEVIAVGRVLDAGRGSLPFALVHGEALVTTASWALSQAQVLPLDLRTTVAAVVDASLPLVLHDSLCPMTPPVFIAACVRRAVEAGVVVVDVHPVTDTVRVVQDGALGATVDRDALARVVSPVVLPAERVADRADDLDDPMADLAVLVENLRRSGPVELVEAPPEALRVSGPDDVRLLEALTRPWV